LKSNDINILDLSYEQLKEWLASKQEKTYQADQIVKWVYREMVIGFDDMVDLKPGLIEKLKESAHVSTLDIVDLKESADRQTCKMLLQANDGKTIETSLMKFARNGISRERRTVCVSSQVGCAIGCRFCATGQQGFERNLSAGEIVEQVIVFMRYLRNNIAENPNTVFWPYITHVVFMGMGEPLANFDNVGQAINILNSPKGLNLGIRQITLSTCGLIPRILQLGNNRNKFELAISLHAASNELRDYLVPINRKYPLNELIAACKVYYQKTGRRPFFEYALFNGVNDTQKDAENLVRLLKDFKVSVNLIIGNETSDLEFKPSSRIKAIEFQKHLMAGGLRTMIRVSKGSDIEAGCGQLKSRRLDK
jgi:23S rRNA (adenine2503-C2)-methyltransferase